METNFAKLNDLIADHLMDGDVANYSNDAADAILIVKKFRMDFIANLTVTDHMTFITLTHLLETNRTVTIKEHKAEMSDPIATAICKAYLAIHEIEYD